MKTGISMIDAAVAKRKKALVISMIVVLLIGIGFGIWGAIVMQKETGQPNWLHQSIYAGSKKTGEYAYVEIADTPYLFAERDSSERLYFVMDKGGYLYIVRLDNATAAKLERTDFEESAVIVEGYTKKITGEVREIALDSLDASVGITSANFEDYFGYIYLDTVSSGNTAVLQMMVVVICGVVVITLLINIGITALKTKKVYKKYDQEEWYNIGAQLEQLDMIHFAKEKLYLTADYMVHLASVPNVLRYNDMMWIYRHDVRQNGALVGSYAKIHTGDKKIHMVRAFGDPYEVINAIAAKNQQMLIGFTPENKRAVKEMGSSV